MNDRIIFPLLILAIFLPAWLQAQVPAPATPQDKPVVLLGGTAHIGDGNVIEEAAIVFDKGKITSVGKVSALKDTIGSEVINTEGKHIYPGLILPNTNLGLVEINAVRATLDYDEVGEINPNVRSIIAYNAESELIPTLRFNGILLAQVTPRGGLISGSSSVVELDAWNWQDAVIKMDEGIHLNWPKMYKENGWWAEPGERTKNENYGKQVNDLETLFSDASAYAKLSNPETTNLKLEAMKGLFDGSKKLYIHAGYGKEIIEGIKLAGKYQIEKIILVGGEDAMMAIDLLKENNIPVILANLHRLPERPAEEVDGPYKLAYTLQQEGILVSLGYQGTMNARNLPFFAGTATAYGMDKEEALKTVTLNTAKILGVDNIAGTLAEGKDAYIVVSSGDLLDMRTNNVEYAYVKGRKIKLDNKQQALYKKYKEKYTR